MNILPCRIGLPLVSTAFALLAGCGTTTIRSDLVLEPNASAVMQLHQTTDTLDVSNDGGAEIRVRVIDKKENVVTSLPLSPHDSVRLDLLPAREVEISNQGDSRAIVRWVLRNGKAIEYSLTIQPGSPAGMSGRAR